MAKTVNMMNIVAAMDVAKNAPSAKYLEERIIQLFSAGKVSDGPEIINILKKNSAARAREQDDTGGMYRAFRGEDAITTVSKNNAEQAATRARQLLETGINKVQFDVAINANANILRGYTANGSSTEDHISKYLDDAFNAWLFEKNLTSLNSEIVQVDIHGNTIRDSANQVVKADVARLLALIEDKQEGYITFMAKRGIEVEVNQLPYPQEAVATPEAKAPLVDEPVPVKADRVSEPAEKDNDTPSPS